MRYLPPSLELLLKELDLGAEVSDQIARLRGGLLRELRDQAEWTLEHWEGYADRRSPRRDQALVAPGDALNPIVSDFKCYKRECMTRFASGFARYVALYTDGAVVPDYLTRALSSGDERRVASVIRAWAPQLVDLLPLVRAGCLRFARPIHDSETPDGKAHRLLHEAVRELIDHNKGSFHLTYFPHGRRPEVHIRNPKVLDGAETIIRSLPLDESQLRRLARIANLGDREITLPKSAVNLFARNLTQDMNSQLHGLLIQMHTAAATHATLLVGAPAETFVLDRQGSMQRTQRSLRLDRMHTVRLPWIDELSVTEAVQLRDEAGVALERLRGRVAAASKSDDPRQLADLVAELNDEAAEVSSELKALRSGLPKVADWGYASLGIGLILYGVTQSSLVAAAAGFATVAGKLRDEARARREGTTRQLARPGYALLKARQLLGRRRVRHRPEPETR